MALLHALDIQAHHDIHGDLLDHAYSLVRADEWDISAELSSAWRRLRAEYANLPTDKHLPDGGAYRFRRYDSFDFNPRTGELRIQPHRSYFQDTDINEVTGGIVREFAPLTPAIASNPFLHELIRFDFTQFPLADNMRERDWQVDVHLIRVVAQAGMEGQPTPEGIHRDGAEFVTVHLAEIENVTGGKVSIYNDDKQHIESFTLHDVLDSYLFRDAVLWHGVTPIQPRQDGEGVRSILTFDYHMK